jgi:hypothetical protein
MDDSKPGRQGLEVEKATRMRWTDGAALRGESRPETAGAKKAV